MEVLPVNQYAICYTVYNPTTKEHKHRKTIFKSDADLLGAADEGMVRIFEEHESGQDTEVLFRSVELVNAKEVYQRLTGKDFTDV